jgi:hypothetical protein
LDTLRALSGRQIRLRIYVGESDHAGHRPLSTHLLDLARAQKLAGCTVYRAIGGFGANSVLHTSNILALSSDLPIVVEIVDTREHIEAFLATLEPAVHTSLVTLEEIEVRHYGANR